MIGESPSPPLYTSDGAEVTVSLSHYERDGPMVHVAGKIHGMLALQVQLDEPPSAEEGMEIDVEFEVEAQKVEF
ncbi:MAG TPA: hypothetical protein VLO13_00225 [Halomonas sp.]|nr:hypothetical protein [Halomonas sp.]